jgi:uncharacterized membrane protein YesL
MDDLTPNTYVRITLQCLWDQLPMVLLGGLGFSLLAAPAFVLFALELPYAALLAVILLTWPAWSALLAFEAALLDERRLSVRLFLDAFRRDWMRSVRLGLLAAVPVVAWLWTAPLLDLPKPPTLVWLGLAADATGLLVILTLGLYAVPLIVLHDQPFVTALRNSLVLASRRLGNTLGLVSMGVLAALAVYYISPALLFIFPAFCGLFIVNNLRLVLIDEKPPVTTHAESDTER